MPTRHDIRNVAIVAHVDHGKTTLVDAMLKQAGAFAAHAAESLDDRMMDSNDLEREKGITILAKNTAVKYHPKDGGDADHDQHHRHPRPRRLRRRGRARSVDGGRGRAAGRRLRGPAAADPLRAAQGARRPRLPVILCINKTDRPDSRIDEVVNETYDLFLDLDADEEQIEFPIVYACARDGVASLTKPEDGTVPADSDSLEPFFSTILEHVPAPAYDEDAPLQAHVTNLDADNFLGRIALLPRRAGRAAQGPDRRVDQARRHDVQRPHHRADDDRGAHPQARREGRARATSAPSPVSRTS